MITYREPLFRPPAEANSLIFQVSFSCPHNSCSFCQLYKGVKYQVKNNDDLFREIEWASKQYPNTKRIFLADGDVMFLEFKTLKNILIKLNNSFANLARVNLYANGSSILSKSKQELCELRKLKLNTFYMGLESGSDKLLHLVHKNEDSESMINAVKRAQESDLKCSVMILLGLGGKKYSNSHILKSSEVINKMQPRLLSALRFIEVDKKIIYPEYESITEYEAVNELYDLVKNLNLNRTVFTANHSSNPYPLKGRFPSDKAKLLREIERVLVHYNLDRNGVGEIPLWL